MKLNKQQINAVANKVYNELELAKKSQIHSKENEDIIEKFKKEYSILNKASKEINTKINTLKEKYCKILKVRDTYILSEGYSNKDILNRINLDVPNIETIKQEIILSSISEDPQDLESMIANLVAKFSK